MELFNARVFQKYYKCKSTPQFLFRVIWIPANLVENRNKHFSDASLHTQVPDWKYPRRFTHYSTPLRNIWKRWVFWLNAEGQLIASSTMYFF